MRSSHTGTIFKAANIKRLNCWTGQPTTPNRVWIFSNKKMGTPVVKNPLPFGPGTDWLPLPWGPTGCPRGELDPDPHRSLRSTPDPARRVAGWDWQTLYTACYLHATCYKFEIIYEILVKYEWTVFRSQVFRKEHLLYAKMRRPPRQKRSKRGQNVRIRRELGQ